MKKIALFVLVASLGWASCVKETTPQQLSKKQIQQKVDSILLEKNKELEQAGKIDLNLRYKIEVKVKTDSILNARKTKPAADSTAKSKKANPNPQGFLGLNPKIPIAPQKAPKH